MQCINSPVGNPTSGDQGNVSNQASELKRRYTIAMALVVCLVLALQVLIFSSLRVQQRLARLDALELQHQSLTLQAIEAAARTYEPTQAASGNQLGLPAVAREWSKNHQSLLRELQGHPEGSLQWSASGPLLASSVIAQADGGFLNAAQFQSLADLVREIQPRVTAEAAEAVRTAREQAHRRRDWLWGASIAIVAFTVVILAFQAWCVFGRALWLVTREQKHVDQITRRSALILDSAGDAIWVVDRTGRTTYVNPAATKITGWSAEDLLGKSQHEVLRHSNAEGAVFDPAHCPICKAFREGQSHYAPGDMFWRKDQTSFPSEYHSTPISEGKEIVGAVLTFRDISEHRLLQSKLVHAQKLESIGQLAAGIAHEINTPIQFIGDNTRFLKDAFDSLHTLLAACEQVLTAAERGEPTAELIQEARAVAEAADMPYLSAEVPKSIDQSLEGIARVTRIVRAMKDFSHPDGDAKAPTDINRAIESTVTVARNEWKYVAELQLNLDPDLPPVACLAGALNQVILNLVVNAAHAIGELRGENTVTKGLITISTRREDDLAVIRIRDTGAGIPPAIRAKIFDPFFTTKPVGKGTGQGLAIAHTVVVEKHGGTISVESEVGQGTTFTIRIPFGSSEHTAEESEYETTHCAH